MTNLQSQRRATDQCKVAQPFIYSQAFKNLKRFFRQAIESEHG
jgi:hypothetical protein